MIKEYRAVILQKLIPLSILLFLGIIGLAVLSILIIRCAKRDNWEKGMTVFCLVLCLTGIVVGIFCARDLPPMIKDVRESSYVTYTGEWETYEGGSTSRNCSDLLDGSGITLFHSSSGMAYGHHYGTIVYGEHSHFVVKFDLSD